MCRRARSGCWHSEAVAELFSRYPEPELDGFGAGAIHAEPFPGRCLCDRRTINSPAAFEVHAVDYLFKPFYREMISDRLAAPSAGQTPHTQALHNAILPAGRFETISKPG